MLFILILLAMVGFPVYQEYQTRANLAEAESVLGTTERHLRTYFMDHGSFYSATPTPASVPGLGSVGSTSTFTAAGGWTTIGSPVPSGSSVNFSYQAFAGQTPNGTTTPTVNSYLYNPTDDMNLIRRTANASNYHFPDSVGISNVDEPLRFNWSDLNFCSFAQEAAQVPSVEQQKQCDIQCASSSDPNCVQTCLSGGSGLTQNENCQTGCQAAGYAVDDCIQKCANTGDGICDQANPQSSLDIDCYHAGSNSGQTAAENCVSACVAYGKDPNDCNLSCGQNDGKCGDPKYPIGDSDCYSNSAPSPFDTCVAECGGGLECQVQCLASTADSCRASCQPDDNVCYANCDKSYCHNKCTVGAGDSVQACYDSCDGKSPPSSEDHGCAGGQQWDGSSCQCPSGYSWNGSYCGYSDPCYYGGCGGGGGSGYTPPPSGGGNAGGGSSSGGGSSYSSGGSAGGGSSSGSGTTSTGSSGTVATSNNECASFGITKPTDFGILQNVSGYNWAVMTAVGNFTPGSACTLVAKVLQVRDGKVSQSGDFMRINPGE